MSPEDAKDWNSGGKEAEPPPTVHGRPETLRSKQGSAGCLTVLQYSHRTSECHLDWISVLF